MINLVNVEKPLQNALEIIGWYCRHNDCKTCGLKINDDTCITDKDPDVWWMYLNTNCTNIDCFDTCKHAYSEVCDECYKGDKYNAVKTKREDEPQTDYGKILQLFADILFDKEKSEQFLKECKAMGIEP